MKHRLAKTLGLVLLALSVTWFVSAYAPTAARAQEPPGQDDDAPMRTIHVSGTGQASAQPDRAVITVGVRTEAEEASAALDENNEQMQAVIDALVDLRVAEADIQTEVIRLSPRFEQPSPREGAGVQQGSPELVGFAALNLVQVRVQDLDQLGALLDAAVEAGGNQIQNIRFEISEPTALYEQARQAAWEDAQAKAQQLADLADLELGSALTITESSRTVRPFVEAAREVAAAAAVPIQPGTQSVDVDLQVTWLLESTED